MDYNETKKVLNIIGELVVEQYKNDLKNNPKKYGNGRNSIASGKLFNSVDYKLNVDKDLKLYMVVADHYIFVEEGSVYTTKLPPISAIRIWMNQRSIPYIKNADYKIQRSIFKNGIKPKPFIRDIKNDVINNYKDDIEKALKEDIKNFIKQKTKELKNKIKK